MLKFWENLFEELKQNQIYYIIQSRCSTKFAHEQKAGSKLICEQFKNFQLEQIF